MDFNLTRDIVFFDIEATGLNVLKDRIIQIALIKYLPDNPVPVELELLVNPGVPISQESYEIHGISAADVANKPTFPQLAKQIEDFIGDADLSGYNLNRFDVPMLMEEFNRAGIHFKVENRKIIDVQSIFYKMEPRTLVAAHKFYCGHKFEGAHDALADVRATVDVLKGQIKKYAEEDYETRDGQILERPIRNDMQALYDFTHNKQSVDVTNRLKYTSDGDVVFNFGKYIGQKVGPVLSKDKQYYHWILEKDFSVQVKQAVQKILRDYEKENS
jgi:DNA polymerase-3 subunit epsilon